MGGRVGVWYTSCALQWMGSTLHVRYGGWVVQIMCGTVDVWYTSCAVQWMGDLLICRTQGMSDCTILSVCRAKVVQ